MTVDEAIESAVSRFEILFDTFDRVRVSISGGKDSTCILETGLIAARRAGRRLEVAFFDEEVIYPETVEYINRLRARGEFDLLWYCAPIVEGNAWSKEHPYWYPWAPEDERLWVRRPPAWALTSIPGYAPVARADRRSLVQIDHYIARAALPRTTVVAIGRRAAESPARRAIMIQSGWINHPFAAQGRFAAIASPIVDWSNHMPWQVIQARGWDWNRAYLRMYQAGRTKNQMRVGPWFGEEPSVTLYLIAREAPSIWTRAALRVPGATEFARYSRSAMVGRGRSKVGGAITSGAILRALRALPVEKQPPTRRSIIMQIKQALALRMPINPRAILSTVLRGDSKASRKALSHGIEMTQQASAEGHRRLGNPVRRDLAYIQKAQERLPHVRRHRPSYQSSDLDSEGEAPNE